MNSKNRLVFAVVLVSVVVLLRTGLTHARDWTSENKAACEQISQEGFPEWRQANMSRILKPSSDTFEYPYELPIVFHIINHQRRISFSPRISENDISFQLIQLRDTFRQCGIEATAEEVHYWSVPGFLNNLRRSETRSSYLGWEERCLFKPTHRAERINVYFVGGVTDPLGVGTSHAIADFFHVPELEGDEKFNGTAIVTDATRGFAGVYTTVPHEVGHILMNMGHVSGSNVMSDDGNKLSHRVTREQCARALISRFIRKR